MSKILFEFDSVEDREDIKIYSQAVPMYQVLTELHDEFRQKIKYGKPNATDKTWFDRFLSLLDEHGVKLWP